MDNIASSTRRREEGFTVREAARRTRMPPHRVSYYGGNWGREDYGRFITPEIVDAGQGSWPKGLVGSKAPPRIRRAAPRPRRTRMVRARAVAPLHHGPQHRATHL